jgi:hypothetical protein
MKGIQLINNTLKNVPMSHLPKDQLIAKHFQGFQSINSSKKFYK